MGRQTWPELVTVNAGVRAWEGPGAPLGLCFGGRNKEQLGCDGEPQVKESCWPVLPCPSGNGCMGRSHV